MDYRQLLRIMLQDTKQEDLAKELGTTQATISRWLTGQEPRGSALERIRGLARARRLAEDATIEQNLSGSKGHVFEAHQANTHNTPSKSMRTLLDTGDIANLALHTGIAQSGGQSVNNDVAIDENTSDGFWSFPNQVKAGWQNIEQTYAMQVTGDSMEPTLSSGSHVFIDTSHKYPSPPDLYAVNYGHGLTIKRVELLPEDKIRIISDNDRYSDFEFHKQDVEVYGRVVASFQWRG
ncbi:MAG: S24 family peptidase [Lentilitoribacter sp.]